jgi:hypothetical protein
VKLVEEILQGDLTDFSNALRAQFQSIALAINETLILESLERLLETLDVARGVVAEVAPNGLYVNFG